ncbi:hypothetical protein [Microbacterium sp. bgisy189]|uniref:hypothetical protein n=1 Tax=Microbacterium sp. bgisy189 TaxID=3413798 RepID=UPI003EBD81D0
MSGELYPPAQYGWGWIVLAVGIIALVVVLAWIVLALTAPKRPRPQPREVEPFDVVGAAIAHLRGEYLTRIDAVEHAYRAGALDARHANLELSRLARGYVNEYSGLEAPVLSLRDLADRGVHPSLVDALQRHYYPSLFRRGPAIDPTAGAAAARQVVQSWS